MLLICGAMLFSACGAKNIAKEIVNQGNGDDEAIEVDADIDEVDVEDEGDGEDVTEAKSKSKSNTPVLGDDDISGYDGFSYMYCENLRTQSEKNEDTGKMENMEIYAFIPESDYGSVNMNYAYGEKLGVTFRVELEPYIRYKESDYLLSENLEYYVAEKYDPFYTGNQKDVVIGEVEEIDRNAARVTVDYLDYNKYDDSYTPIFATYYLKEFEDGRTVLVSTQVNVNDVTGKTPELIEEMEAFYEFEIYLDKEKGATKLDDFIANGGDNTVTTGYLMFELPDGWSRDNEVSSYDEDVYAPGGDMTFAGCFVSVDKSYLGYGTVTDSQLKNPEQLMAVVKEYLDSEELEADVSVYGDTCLGTAILSVMEMESEGSKAVCHIYWIFDSSYMYRVYALSFDENETENPFIVAEDILQNGQVPN